MEGVAVTLLVGRIHKRLYSKDSPLKDEYGTGDAMCAGLIAVRQLRHSWRNVTCKLCLRSKPKAKK